MKVKWMLFFSLRLPVFVIPHDGNTWSVMSDMVIYGTANEWFSLNAYLIIPNVIDFLCNLLTS